MIDPDESTISPSKLINVVCDSPDVVDFMNDRLEMPFSHNWELKFMSYYSEPMYFVNYVNYFSRIVYPLIM